MSTGIPRAVQEQAAEWLVELQADDHTDSARAQLRQRLHAWRQAHADHDRAWQRIEAMGARLLPLAHTPASAALAQAARSARTGRSRRAAVQHLAVLLFAGGTAGAVAWKAADGATGAPGTWLAHWGADERTSTAERRTLHLPDGTQVELNAETAIDVQYDDALRLVRLRAGELLVTTAPGSAAQPRPFVVETRHGRIRALGTRFTVRQRAAGPSQVAMFEGVTEITPQRNEYERRTLLKGEQSSFDAERVMPTLAADPAALAWTRGMLVAQDMPLGDFLAELSRHRAGHLGCDPAVAGLRVSGTYPLADTDRVLDMLRATLPVQLHTATRYWVTVRPG